MTLRRKLFTTEKQQLSAAIAGTIGVGPGASPLRFWEKALQEADLAGVVEVVAGGAQYHVGVGAFLAGGASA